jgi:hypothetical protein
LELGMRNEKGMNRLRISDLNAKRIGHSAKKSVQIAGTMRLVPCTGAMKIRASSIERPEGIGNAECN